MTSSEDRKNPRIQVDFYADWGLNAECEYFDKITNLSVSGCFLATHREVRAGDVVHLKWANEMMYMFRLRGIVRYQLRLMEGVPATGIGLEFTGLTSEDTRKLEEFVNSYR